MVEEPRFVLTPHTVKGFIPLAISLLIPVVIMTAYPLSRLFAQHSSISPFLQVLLVSGFFMAFVAVAVWATLRRVGVRLLFYDRFVVEHDRWLNRGSRIIPYNKISDVSYSPSLVWRMFDLGTITVTLANGETIRWRAINDPGAALFEIRDQIDSGDDAHVNLGTANVSPKLLPRILPSTVLSAILFLPAITTWIYVEPAGAAELDLFLQSTALLPLGILVKNLLEYRHERVWTDKEAAYISTWRFRPTVHQIPVSDIVWVQVRQSLLERLFSSANVQLQDLDGTTYRVRGIPATNTIIEMFKRCL